ncbi:MAG: hypothetical protein VW268_11250 [Rhodospirillaceae bacterium]
MWGRHFIIAGLVALTACNQTTYHRDDARLQTSAAPSAHRTPNASSDATAPASDPGSAQASGLGRKVSYGLSKDLFRTAPRCVMVLPIADRGRTGPAADAIEDAVARHLSYWFVRVVAARDILRKAWKAAVPLTDLTRLGRSVPCDAVMEIATPGLIRDFAVVWAEARLDLAPQLRRVRDGEALWWGRHVAERS